MTKKPTLLDFIHGYETAIRDARVALAELGIEFKCGRIPMGKIDDMLVNCKEKANERNRKS